MDVDTAWVARYRGLPLNEVLALADLERRRIRIVRPGDAITMDYSPQRLNVLLDDAGDLAEVSAG